MSQKDIVLADRKRVFMSSRQYATLVCGVVALLFGGLYATGNILLCVDQLKNNYPYRAYPPVSEIGPFFKNWGVSDALIGSFPALAYVHQAFQAGHMPLWNPLEGLGLPASGSAGTGYMYPIHWLTYGLLSPLAAWHVELVAIILIGSLASFAVLKRLTGCGEAAAIGATAWAFGGWCSAYLQVPAYAWSFALFPFGLLAVERAREGRPWSYMQLALCLTCLLTGGHPQMLPPALGLIALWALWRAKQRRLGLALAMLAGGLMACYHILPMAELLKLSEREPVSLSLVLTALMLPREFLCMIFPTLMGQPSDNFYFGTYLASPVINGREHCVFVGVLTLMFALLAVWRRPVPSSRPLGALAVSGLLLAGTPLLYGLLCRAFPPLLFLTPTRFLPFALFGVCVLSAQGWRSLREQPLQRSETRALLTVLAAFCAGALYYILPATMLTVGFQDWLLKMAEVNFAAKPPYFEGDFGPVFVDRVLAHFSFTSPPIAVSFLVVISTAVLLLRYTGKPMPFRPVFALLCLDLAMYFSVMNTPAPMAAYFPANPDIAHLSQGTTLNRNSTPPGRVLGLGDGPHPNLLLVEGIANLEAYESAHPGDYRRVIDALNGDRPTPHQGAFYIGAHPLGQGVMDLLGLDIVYNSPMKWDEGYGSPSYRGAGLSALDRTSALRAFLIDTYRPSDRADALETMMGADFDPRSIALVDQIPSYPSPLTPRFEKIEPTDYQPQRVSFQVSTDHPTLLILNDLHYPGWRVSVNGLAKPLIKAYGFARAVELAPGESKVVFAFRPTGFPYTPWLSLIVFFMLLGFSLHQWKTGQRVPAGV